jgi:hypothetical protein
MATTTITPPAKRGMPPMAISTWRPRYDPGPKTDADGGTKYVHAGWYVETTVYSHPGDIRVRAFTVLDAYLGGHRYSATLDRAYSRRWFSRLAGWFEHQCYCDAKARDAI